jgi:hypothetical protein
MSPSQNPTVDRVGCDAVFTLQSRGRHSRPRVVGEVGMRHQITGVAIAKSMKNGGLDCDDMPGAAPASDSAHGHPSLRRLKLNYPRLPRLAEIRVSHKDRPKGDNSTARILLPTHGHHITINIITAIMVNSH